MDFTSRGTTAREVASRVSENWDSPSAYLGDGDFFSGFYCALGLVSIVCGLVVLFIRSQLRARTGNTPAADS